MKLNPLDILFSQYIRMRAIRRVGGCERCLTPKFDKIKEDGTVSPAYKQLQCSHFIGRSRRAVRWDADNAAGICAGCHMYLTAHPAEHVRWFMEYVGEQRVDYLMARNRNRDKPDIQAITIYIKTKIGELDIKTEPLSEAPRSESSPSKAGSSRKGRREDK